MIAYPPNTSSHHNPFVEKSANYAIFILDGEGNIENWNEDAQEMLGYENEQIIGQHFSIFFSTEDNLKSKAKSLLEEVVKYGKTSNKGWLKRKDGSEFVSRLLINSICNDKKEAIGYLVILRNLRAQKQIKQTHQKSTKGEFETQAAEAGKKGSNYSEELKALKHDSEMISHSLSHDLRAPLRAIDGYIKIMQEDCSESLTDEGKEMLELVYRNAGKLSKMIDSLLTFSRVLTRETKKTNVDMNELAGSVLLDLNKSSIYKAKVTISNLHPVFADYSLMNIVFYNLISNALKFSASINNPTIKISSKEKDGIIIYTVKDNGIGFDMKQTRTLFETFNRFHGQEVSDGFGMGLAIVKRIVSKHGGDIWVESEPEKGATFYFSLPI